MIPVRSADIRLGHPLPYSLYDINRKLLLRAGNIVATVNQLNVLSEKGLYKEKVEVPVVTAREGKEGEKKDDAPQQIEFEDIRLGVGDSWHLQAQDESGVRTTVKLMGATKGKSVLVSAPLSNGSYLNVKEGAGFVVRFFAGQSAYAFTAHVLKMVNTPYPYLHLSYPKTVAGMQIRKGLRVNVSLICALLPQGKSSVSGMLLDLSKGGARALAAQVLGEVGDEVQGKFKLVVEDTDHLVTLRCAIRSKTPTGDPTETVPKCFYGLDFIEVEPNDRLALSAYVSQRLLEQSEA